MKSVFHWHRVPPGSTPTRQNSVWPWALDLGPSFSNSQGFLVYREKCFPVFFAALVDREHNKIISTRAIVDIPLCYLICNENKQMKRKNLKWKKYVCYLKIVLHNLSFWRLSIHFLHKHLLRRKVFYEHMALVSVLDVKTSGILLTSFHCESLCRFV